MNEDVVITGFGATTATAPTAETLWEQVSKGTVRFPKGTVRFPEFYPKADRPPRAQTPLSPFEKGLFFAHSPLLQSLKMACLLDAKIKISQKVKRLTFSVSASKQLFGPNDSILPPEALGERLCDQFEIEAERHNVIAACATGAYSAALGAASIAHGECDIAIVGSVEPPANELITAGFSQMGVLTSEKTMRPFDRRRSGFVLGSGAGIVILESRRHAEARGVPIQARLSGWGLGSDPHSAVAFNSNGAHIADVIGKALRRGGLVPQQIEHVNAHGTATRLNDWIETQALMKAFGSHAENLKISATKSSTGHLLGAAGSVELILTIQALQHQFIPPTAHLEEADPECPLNYTPKTGRSASFDHALSLSFGFGGPIGALVVSRS